MTFSSAAERAKAHPIPAAAAPATTVWIWCALVVAVGGLKGSLLLSLALGLKACPLCFYQRTFAMSVVGVLAMGLLAGAGRTARLGLLVLPLAVAGLGVAAFHVFLEWRGTLECPAGLFGLGTAPQQSLGTFLVLVALLLGDVLGNRAGQGLPLVGGVALGALLAVGACTSNPPLPQPPRQAYPTTAPDICRPPFHSP